MIDSNTLYTASNIMAQAGYTIKAAAPSAPVDYTALTSLVTTAVLAILAAAAGLGRAFQAWKTGNTASAAIFLGAKSPITPTPATTITKTTAP